MSAVAPLLVSPAEAMGLQNAGKQLAFLDATWFMPNSPKNAQSDFLSRRIPHARRLNLDEVASEHELGLKHMMPDSQTFATACGKMGITPSTHVVVYDTHGVFSSPRALFMFRSFGHQNSSVLDGGLPHWIDEGLPLESGTPKTQPLADYSPPAFNSNAVKSYDQVVENSVNDPGNSAVTELVLDARSGGRFTGVDPEPRPGLSSGHIPHSFSLPFNLFLRKQITKEGNEYTVFRTPEDIRTELEKAVGPAESEKIIKGERSVITSCGSGMTAAVLWLGLKILGVNKIGLYDESWTGYAMRPSSKIEKS